MSKMDHERRNRAALARKDEPMDRTADLRRFCIACGGRGRANNPLKRTKRGNAVHSNGCPQKPRNRRRL